MDKTVVYRLRKFQATRFKALQHVIFWVLLRKNLKGLARVYGSDKWGHHRYAEAYMRHFDDLRNKRVNILELGIGGYTDMYSGGGSLRMWKTYFWKGLVHGIDIYEKTPHAEKRIRIGQGSQTDKEFLEDFCQGYKFDCIIDDGSHINADIIESFKMLFRKLKPGGWYVIEDLQTSYWEEYGGREDVISNECAMSFILDTVHSCNREEMRNAGLKEKYSTYKIQEAFFYHNIVFLKKG